MENKNAVILLSGGLDSATVLKLARSDGFKLFALSFNYGQKHDIETECSKLIAKDMVEEHRFINIDLGNFGGSALTSDIPVPKHETVDQIDSNIPITYVPARNTIFLSFALAYAEVINANDIFIGVNALDYSGYPDCRPEFIMSFEKMANLATASGVSGNSVIIHAPLIHLTKAQIISKGIELNVDYGNTTSCYDPSPEGYACGQCDACLLRLKGFSEVGIKDPKKYRIHQKK